MPKFVQPKVRLIAIPHVLQQNIQDFIVDEGCPGWESDADDDADLLCEFAGRVCYMSFAKPRPGGNAAYLDNILAQKHGSVLEHANFTIVATGVSRNLTHELVRHRAGFSYSQLSQRYVDESDVTFIEPEAMQRIRHTAEYADWQQQLDKAAECYRQLSAALTKEAIAAGYTSTAAVKYARQAARSILPGCTETKIVVTANARAWRHFAELRGSAAAEPEIRNLAIMVLAELKGHTRLMDDIKEVDGVLHSHFAKV